MAHKQKGFTVVELMITIAIFGIVLLLFTFGALQISRNYQQANTKIQLATTTRLIHSDFTQELQFSGLDIVPTQTIGSYEVTCLGDVRYIRYASAVQTDANYGLLYSQDLAGAVTCTSPVVVANANLLLPTGTKATQFSVSGAGIYTLNSRFVAGQQDMFVSNDYTNSCKSASVSARFCAVVELKSTVTRKVQ